MFSYPVTPGEMCVILWLLFGSHHAIPFRCPSCLSVCLYLGGPTAGVHSPQSVSVIPDCMHGKYGQAVVFDHMLRLSRILQKAKQVFPFWGRNNCQL